MLYSIGSYIFLLYLSLIVILNIAKIVPKRYTNVLRFSESQSYTCRCENVIENKVYLFICCFLRVDGE